MSIPWSDYTQEGASLLDCSLSNILSFEFPDKLEPIEPAVNAIFDTETIPSDGNFDWSGGIDPTLCQWPIPDYFAVSSPLESGDTSGNVSSDEQSLKQIISQLTNRLDQLERGVEARLSEIEASVGGMGQRLMKAEEAKEACDAEMEQRKEQIRTASKKLLEDLQDYRELANIEVERLLDLKKTR